ncbi:uncharacterized protein PITG_17851 [Phytophthora infestans T30-4]|uniref:Alcohol dehydrogenase n=1 Tax=Phytophthora infestans (strain T30-4) TaxID=403677 RepID=D0NWU7_PHYIT|nr:uncharacterized protein PITG_17851 [Phytophthora infestans T30-4]EEY67534.1 conserved hypothetical protein [Phytophthora infestans T30-4]|eukprot:XP_002896393.1 conserved hypothetical protein [Phytophthora infestans T30-4]
MCAGSTVYSPLKREGVKAGDRVGVVGIGGLGHLALQFIVHSMRLRLLSQRQQRKKKRQESSVQPSSTISAVRKIRSIQDVADTLKLAAEKNVRPIVENLPMDQVNEGIERIQEGKARYRIVLEN